MKDYIGKYVRSNNIVGVAHDTMITGQSMVVSSSDKGLKIQYVNVSSITVLSEREVFAERLKGNLIGLKA